VIYSLNDSFYKDEFYRVCWHISLRLLSSPYSSSVSASELSGEYASQWHALAVKIDDETSIAEADVKESWAK